MVVAVMGAQTLIRDVAAGFFILVEDHYAVGDIMACVRRPTRGGAQGERPRSVLISGTQPSGGSRRNSYAPSSRPSGFPFGLSFRTTNCIESLNSLAAQRCGRLHHWKNSNHRQRWLSLALLEIEPQLNRVRGHKDLGRLRAVLEQETQKPT